MSTWTGFREPLKRLVLTRSGVVIAFSVSLNDFVRSRQHVRWNRETDLLGRFQVDDELELFGLFHREIGGLGAFQNPVHVSGSAA